MDDTEEIIVTRDLCKSYGDVVAVDHLNLSIRRGEVFGLLGPNGAGKTTTTLMLLGLTDPTGGKAEIDGYDCTKEPLAVKSIVGYLPDNVGFYGNMTGLQNLVFTGMMNGLKETESKKRTSELLDRVSMTYAAERKAGTYSRGMRQRLGIADVLMKDPEIVIMDEPAIGIDPVGVRDLTKLIRELSVEDGRTILISSHELYQIQEISDRVGIFVKGKLIACGRISDLGKQLNNEGLYTVDVHVNNAVPETVAAVIRPIEGIRSVSTKADGSLHVEASRDIRREMLGRMLQNDFIPSSMDEKGGSLFEIYRKYFEKAGEDNGADSTGGTAAKGAGREKSAEKQPQAQENKA
jgi:ABC-2 type transport system ATP-binding protein